MSDLEIEHDRLSRRQALAAAIVGILFALAMLAVLHFVMTDPPVAKSKPMILPAADLP